ncbi:MAG: hypothetical protein ACFFBP_15145 [Promethearchaeota archaeon]
MKKIGHLIIGFIIGAALASSVFIILPLFYPNVCATRYCHTIIIDGVNDFNNNEHFTTSSTGYDGYIAWDCYYIYFGLHGPDFAATDANKWVLIYIGNGGSGTTAGQLYGTQGPTLPFYATHYIRWRLDDFEFKAFEWTGSWTDASWDVSGDAYRNSTLEFFEMRVPIVDLGSPSNVLAHVSMIDEFGNWTYSGVPSTSFTDGNDPDYTKFFLFDLDGTSAPANYIPI